MGIQIPDGFLVLNDREPSHKFLRDDLRKMELFAGWIITEIVFIAGFPKLIYRTAPLAGF